MPPHHRHQGPRANSKTPAGKRMPLENISNTVGYHIRKYFYEILILSYFRKFSHSKITTYTVFRNFVDQIYSEGPLVMRWVLILLLSP